MRTHSLPLVLLLAAAPSADSLAAPSATSHAGGASTVLGPAGTWQALPATLGMAVRRHGHSAIHDPIADRVILFGGSDGTFAFHDELLEMDVCGRPGLRLIGTQGQKPSGRHSHVAVYDPVRARMIVMGGDDGSPTNDVWALDLSADPPPGPLWDELSPAGAPPSARLGHSAIYDPLRDRMIVFGGFDGVGFLNDLWALNLSGPLQWAPLAPAGTPPSARDFHSAVYDPVRDRMVVFGGNDGSTMNDVWALDLSGSPTWSTLAASGSPPGVRMSHGALFDAAEDRMLVIAGSTGNPLFDYYDVWELRFTPSPAWSPIGPDGMFLGWGSSRAMVLAPGTGRVLSHGGKDRDSTASSVSELVPDDPPLWGRRSPQDPSLRQSHVALFDPVRQRFLMHGGEGGGYDYGTQTIYGDVFEMSAHGLGIWTRSRLTGPEPTPRFGHAAVHDPVRDRVLMHGGYDGAFLGDLWSLSLGSPMSWAPVATSGTPPSTRDFACLAHDPLRDRLVLFGGNRQTGFLNDVWVLDLTAPTPAWSLLSPAGTPPSPRLAAGAVLDASRDRLIVFGGYDGAPLDDLWALEFSPAPQWTPLAPGGAPPGGRHGASLVLDTFRDRLVLFGGIGTVSSQEVWELPLSGGPFDWTPLLPASDPPIARHGHTAVYDPVYDRMLVTGGYTSGGPDMGYRSDSWTLVWGASTSVPPEDPAFGFQGLWPNPATERPRLVFSLPSPSRVEMGVFDVAGRRMARVDLGTVPAGPHRIPMEGLSRLPAGLYVVRLETEFGTLRRRWARLR